MCCGAVLGGRSCTRLREDCLYLGHANNCRAIPQGFLFICSTSYSAFEQPRLALDALPAKKVFKFTSIKKHQDELTGLFGAYTVALLMEDTVAEVVVPNLVKVARAT